MSLLGQVCCPMLYLSNTCMRMYALQSGMHCNLANREAMYTRGEQRFCCYTQVSSISTGDHYCEDNDLERASSTAASGRHVHTQAAKANAQTPTRGRSPRAAPGTNARFGSFPASHTAYLSNNFCAELCVTRSTRLLYCQDETE